LREMEDEKNYDFFSAGADVEGGVGEVLVKGPVAVGGVFGAALSATLASSSCSSVVNKIAFSSLNCSSSLSFWKFLKKFD